MRFELMLSCRGRDRRLPINYQYPVSSWLYQVLDRSDTDFARFLHDEGYLHEGRRFRLFCFGDLDARPFRREGDRLRLLGPSARLVMSFALPQAAQHFLQGMLAQQALRLADRHSGVDFLIESVRMLPEPVFTGADVVWQTASPVVVSRPNARGHADYLAPDAPDYAERLYANLMSKYQAHTTAGGGHLPPPLPYDPALFDLEVLSAPRSRLVTIAAGTPRETQVRGFHYRLRLRCAPDWQAFIWRAGLGEKGSQGFGLLETGTAS